MAGHFLIVEANFYKELAEAQKKGAKVVVIDPYRSRTAKEADWHIAPKAGTDGALAMGLIHVLIEENLIDQDFVKSHTLGYNELSQRAKNWTPEKTAEVTGLQPDDIRGLA